MSLTLGPNIIGLRVQRFLSDATGSVASLSERLASGQRITRASDDAAGLAISTSLNKDARVFTQALRNVNDGISLYNIAESSLKSLGDITQRQLELAETSANGIYSATQRKALQSENAALTSEYNRIINSATFNGAQVFNADGDQLTLQIGGSGQTLSGSVGQALARDAGTGTFNADLNGDGIDEPTTWCNTAASGAGEQPSIESSDPKLM